MDFICGIDEGNRRSGPAGGVRPHRTCAKSFTALSYLLRHIRLQHTTVMGNGRRSAKGKQRNPVTHRWEDKP